MGGVMDITQRLGAHKHGVQELGTTKVQWSRSYRQPSVTTAVGTPPYAQSLDGWGRDTWGSAAWGILDYCNRSSHFHQPLVQ